MQFLKEVAPHISRVAMLFNPDHPDNEPREVRRTSALLGVQLQSIEFRGRGDLDVAFQAAIQGGADAFYVVSSRQTILNMPHIVEFATKNKLPVAGGWGDWAKAGALLSYGPNTNSISRQAATYVDKILKGARPADLPVQQPVGFELIINGRTAKVLGLTIPPAIVAQADEIIG